MPIVKKLQQHKLLLDTHVWIWLMEGDLGLSRSFQQAVDRAKKYDGNLISAISVWELGMLVEKKRLELAKDPLDWAEQSLHFKGMRLVPITPRIAIQSTRLPGNLHADPADRLLVASAFEENAVLVTCDAKLLEYGKDRFISAYNPTL